MCAYSNVNNVPACQNPILLKDGLDQQANFQGFIGSDWGGDHSTVASIDAGFDVEMPNGYFNDSLLLQAIQQKQVTTAQVNAMVSGCSPSCSRSESSARRRPGAGRR